MFRSVETVPGTEPPLPPPPTPPDDEEDPPGWDSYATFIKGITAGIVHIPTRTGGGGITTTPVDPDAPPHPAFFLVEVYGISSFLGDYGLGRTVKTFTLLPGETTTMSLRTWKATKTSIKEG